MKKLTILLYMIMITYVNADISCVSCHDLKRDGVDEEVTAIGHEKQENLFHLSTPTVLNTVLSSKLFFLAPMLCVGVYMSVLLRCNAGMHAHVQRGHEWVDTATLAHLLL